MTAEPRRSIFDKPELIGARSRVIAQQEGRACEHCGTTLGPIERHHRGTSYDYPAISENLGAQEGDENDPNYATLCCVCWLEDNEYWEEM